MATPDPIIQSAPTPASKRGDKLTEPNYSPSAERLALSPAEAAAALGISRRTIDALLADDAIPHARIGARVLIPVAELRAWLSSRTEGGAA